MSIKSNGDGFLNYREASAYLKCSERSLRDLVRKGVVPFYKFSERKILFKQIDLDSLIKKFNITLGGDNNGHK